MSHPQKHHSRNTYFLLGGVAGMLAAASIIGILLGHWWAWTVSIPAIGIVAKVSGELDD